MQCPHCKEEIRAGATKCPLCAGNIKIGGAYGVLMTLGVICGSLFVLGFLFFGSGFEERLAAGLVGAFLGVIGWPFFWFYMRFMAPSKG